MSPAWGTGRDTGGGAGLLDPHPEASTYARKFSGRYEHRVIEGGIGHNLPQEAPRAFADAVIDVTRL